MNKSWKTILTVSVICLILGLSLVVVAAASGGSFERIGRNASLGDVTKSFNGENITGLDLSLDIGRLQILPGDEFRVEAEHISENSFVCEVRGGLLVVEDGWRNLWTMSFGRGPFFRGNEPSVKVYIPENTKLRVADIHVSAGECRIDGLLAERLSVAVSAGSLQAVDVKTNEFTSSVSAGRCRIDSLVTDSAVCEISAGELQINGIQTRLCHISQSAGRIYVSGDIFEKGEFESSLGMLSLILEGRTMNDYTTSLDVGLGEVSVNGRIYTNTDTIIGSGSSTLDLNCGLGQIELVFE